jgi:putative glutamine amidotransferase
MKRVLLAAVILALAGCQSAPDNRKPLIGITSVYLTDDPAVWCSISYVDAVVENGGTPLILPAIADDAGIQRYAAELDGLVLVGGADIPPAAYNQQPHSTTIEMPRRRFNFERTLINRWFDTGKPMLGVCLGMQMTNVSRGGTLVQDIPSQIGSDIDHRAKSANHPVDIDPASRLAAILGTRRAEVYSFHHQAVGELAPNLEIVARSPDGVPEAMERTDGPFGLFVQWHPELMPYDKPHRDAIYGALIHAAKKH